jgi:hypothetical protein
MKLIFKIIFRIGVGSFVPTRVFVLIINQLTAPNVENQALYATYIDDVYDDDVLDDIIIFVIPLFRGLLLYGTLGLIGFLEYGNSLNLFYPSI